MRFLNFKIWLLIILLAAGGQIFAQTAGKIKKESDSASIFEKVYKNLVAKPAWLVTDEALCPLDVIPDSETEIEYGSAGCLENAETCFDKCKNNDGNACYALALLIQEKKDIFQKQSEFLFLRACKLGVVSGCTNRAAAIFNLKEADEKSVKCAVDTFEKTCEKDDPWGCTMFGFALMQGKSRPKNPEKALEILAKSCKYGDADDACKMAKQLIQEIKKSQTIY